jgi:hypothetical protein
LAHPAQSIRSPGAKFYRLDCGFEPVVLTIRAGYLVARQDCRNEAAVTISARDWNLIMTTFDKREEGFEKKFALDEEKKFKAKARRNKLLGMWVATSLGMSGDAADAYARGIVAAEFGEGGDADVVRKVIGDLKAKGIVITEAQIHAQMSALMAQAIAQVKAGI